jgi:hypothetical protein
VGKVMHGIVHKGARPDYTKLTVPQVEILAQIVAVFALDPAVQPLSVSCASRRRRTWCK